MRNKENYVCLRKVPVLRPVQRDHPRQTRWYSRIDPYTSNDGMGQRRHTRATAVNLTVTYMSDDGYKHRAKVLDISRNMLRPIRERS